MLRASRTGIGQRWLDQKVRSAALSAGSMNTYRPLERLRAPRLTSTTGVTLGATVEWPASRPVAGSIKLVR